MRRERWSDNDRHFGPFTYARDRRYQPLAFVLTSGSAEDSDWHEFGESTCSLRISAFGHTLILALPQIIQPYRKKVYPGNAWDAETVARLGRGWYWDIEKREFGFSSSEGFLQVFRGRHTMDSSTDQSWGWFYPWKEWRHVRHSFYGLSGEHVVDAPHWDCPALIDWQERHAAEERAEAMVPTVAFHFADFDKEELTATTRIEEREWRRGVRGWRWLSLFWPKKVQRSLDIRFSGETGRRKGSWKGGTIGTGIDMLPGELHASAFRRYCAENNMLFGGQTA